jgi:hypothetical protein
VSAVAALLRTEVVVQDSQDTQASRRGAEVIVVRAIDADGKPVAGAEVHLFQHQAGPMPGVAGKHQAFGPFRTGADGCVHIGHGADVPRWSLQPHRVRGRGREARRRGVQRAIRGVGQAEPD